jgi:Protein of unknown function (DUF2752)
MTAELLEDAPRSHGHVGHVGRVGRVGRVSHGSQVSHASMWDPDEPLAAFPRRVLRAGVVAAAWGVAALPVALGWQQCAVARLLHEPCPGCGMTRAVRLLLDGQVTASLRLHPLAVPVLLVGTLFMGATVWTTLAEGSPLHIHETRLGKATLVAMVVVYGAALVLWVLRWFGLFGGPVPVF